MSTTMHAHIEVKQAGKWHHYANPIVEKNYQLFAILAGVRKDDFEERGVKLPGPVCTNYGLPENTSLVTAACYSQFRPENHHAGWICRDQIEELQEALYKANPDVDRTAWPFPLDLDSSIFRTYINEGAISAHRGFENVRIVFWFTC